MINYQKQAQSLGPSAESIIKANKEEISERQVKDRIEKGEGKTGHFGMGKRNTYASDRGQGKCNGGTSHRERMPLKDRVNAIFKKYVVSAVAVISSVGVVIGLIVSNLKNGLTSLAKDVGNGLKTIAGLLPGKIGGIASFLFKTAGEAIGFLAKNAWLLIVAVVVYFVEEFKKKQKIKKTGRQCLQSEGNGIK